MSRKQYKLIPPDMACPVPGGFEAACQDALLLALLERQSINNRQYELCSAKLRLSDRRGYGRCKK